MKRASFDNLNTDELDLSGLSSLALIFEIGEHVAPCTFEVASEIDGGFSDNFALDGLTLGEDVGTVQLVDSHDNGNRGGRSECLFVCDLSINPGAKLDINDLMLYVCGDVKDTLDGWVDDGRLFNSLSGIRVYYVGPPQDWTVVDPVCFPSTYSTYNDWLTLGKPDCWCAPYHCDGDADGATQGFQKYRVMSNDLGIVSSNWKKLIDDATLDPCADIDHKSQGFQKYRVMSNDLGIVIANWKKTDADLPGDCPRAE